MNGNWESQKQALVVAGFSPGEVVELIGPGPAVETAAVEGKNEPALPFQDYSWKRWEYGVVALAENPGVRSDVRLKALELIRVAKLNIGVVDKNGGVNPELLAAAVRDGVLAAANRRRELVSQAQSMNA